MLYQILPQIRDGACYRARGTKCLMWDMSYLIVVEVMGNKEAALENMNRMTDRRTGSEFTDGV